MLGEYLENGLQEMARVEVYIPLAPPDAAAAERIADGPWG